MALAAGIGRVCINPPLDIPNGMWLAQKHVRGEGLDLDLQATALVLAEGETRVALLDLDLCFLQDQQAKTIRQLVSEATGIREENVLPFCTHSHAGPVTQDTYHGEGEDRVQSYIQSLPHLIASAATQAAKSVVPVRVAAGMGHSEIGMNRDLRLPDGRFVVGCNPEGFFDPEVGVIRIDTVQGQPLACIVNYACHPTVLGWSNKLISPDYPGSTRRIVEEVTKSTCFFLQGAGGNVGPRETFVGDAAVARRLGTSLGLEAARVYLDLQPVPTERNLRSVVASGAALADYEQIPLKVAEPGLGFVHAFLQLPTRTTFAEVYERAPERLAEWEAKLADLKRRNSPKTEIAEALQKVNRERIRISRMDRYRGKKSLPVESFVIRLGEIAIVAISGEPYSEIGAQVKARSPFPSKTLFAGYVGGDMMYIPTADVYAFQPPPMEVDNSPYAPEAAQIAIDDLVKLLGTVTQKATAP
jgi:hypothetical protein